MQTALHLGGARVDEIGRAVALAVPLHVWRESSAGASAKRQGVSALAIGPRCTSGICQHRQSQSQTAWDFAGRVSEIGRRLALALDPRCKMKSNARARAKTTGPLAGARISRRKRRVHVVLLQELTQAIRDRDTLQHKICSSYTREARCIA